MIRLTTLALMLPLALLAGCGGKSAQNDRRSASGEVLKGTISDDMLQLDKLKSQGPVLAPSETATGKNDAEDAEAGEADEGDEAASDAAADHADEAAPTPQASATPAP